MNGKIHIVLIILPIKKGLELERPELLCDSSNLALQLLSETLIIFR